MKKIIIVLMIALIAMTCVFADSNKAWSFSDEEGYDYVYHETEDFLLWEGGDEILYKSIIDEEDGGNSRITVVFYTAHKEFAVFGFDIPVTGNITKLELTPSFFDDEVETYTLQIDNRVSYVEDGAFAAASKNYALAEGLMTNSSSYDICIYFDTGAIIIARVNCSLLQYYI